jgi:hypothetical protein
MRVTVRALLLLLFALGCTKPASTSPKPTTGSGSDDDFCADLHQNCGPSSNAVDCCGTLICRQRTDETGDVLLHQCLDPNTPLEE